MIFLVLFLHALSEILFKKILTYIYFASSFLPKAEHFIQIFDLISPELIPELFLLLQIPTTHLYLTL